jgi:hypothetical protein
MPAGLFLVRVCPPMSGAGSLSARVRASHEPGRAPGTGRKASGNPKAFGFPKAATSTDIRAAVVPALIAPAKALPLTA